MNTLRDFSGPFAGSELVGVSSTLYTDRLDPRFELALESAERWRNKGLPYVIVDSSPDESGKWVEAALTKREAHVKKAHVPGVATQRMQGIEYAVANGAEKMIGHEAEKTKMSDFSAEISSALDELSVVVVGRTIAAIESLPVTQRRVERVAGWILERTHNLPPDALSGGRGFDRAGAEVLSRYPAQRHGYNNWMYLYETPLRARNEGLMVGGVTVDLTHPKSMTSQEADNSDFDTKRYYQLKLQLEHMLSRPDVSVAATSMSVKVLEILSRMDSSFTNDEAESVLRDIEDLVGVDESQR